MPGRSIFHPADQGSFPVAGCAIIAQDPSISQDGCGQTRAEPSDACDSTGPTARPASPVNATGAKGMVCVKPPSTSRTRLLVHGMKGNEDREVVMDSLAAVEGVMEVEVNLFRSHAVIVHDASCDVRTLANSVTQAGFQVSGIHQ